MSGNKFISTIPHGNWNTLFVDLSRNKLTGNLPPILNRTSYFNLSGNSLSGVIELPPNSYSNIRVLDLSHNEFEGQIPDALGDHMAATLQSLYLQNNKLSGGIDNFLMGKFHDLRELRLGGNRLSVSEGLSRCSSQWRSNGIGPCPVEQIRSFKFPLLQTMDISGSGIGGQNSLEVFGLGEFPSLKFLDLSNNRINGPIPGQIFASPMKVLRLQNNSLAGEIDMSLQSASTLTSIEVLDLSNNLLNYSNHFLQVLLEVCVNLRELRLSGSNFITNHLPTRVGKLEQLEVLDVSNCSLDGKIPDDYGNTTFFPCLKYVDLSQNQLTIERRILEMLSNMASLKYLSFTGNLLGPGVAEGLCTASWTPLDCAMSAQSDPSRVLETWEIIVLVVVCLVFSGGSCLFLGWIWRRRVDRKKHEQDKELIELLLDRDVTHLMPLRQLRRATDDFSEQHEIGIGGFGAVYRGVFDDGTVVAIKKSKRDGSSSEDKCQFLNEVKILSQLHHRNLVRLMGCCLANKNALLVFEFVPNGTLEQHLKRNRGRKAITWEDRLTIAVQTANALDYLHSSANPPIYHLDVKSANILLDNNLNAKVADFGISKLAATPDATHITTLHGFRGTFGYMDPESVVSSLFTGKSDVYAFGVVLLELITAKAAVDRSRGEDVSLAQWACFTLRNEKLEEIIDPLIRDEFCTPYGRESITSVARLAEHCLRFESRDRPTMKEVSKCLGAIQERAQCQSSSSWIGRSGRSRNERSRNLAEALSVVTSFIV